MIILVNKPIHPDAIAYLKANAEVLTPYSEPNDEVLALLVKADGIVLSGNLYIGAQEMDRLPNLRVIGRHGVGLDTVDLNAATARSLPVVYTPYGPTESTAEHAMLLIMATARKLPLLDRTLRAGNFGVRSDFNAMGIELDGKVLGVVGFGRIGRRLADMCRSAFHMSVHVYDPLVPQDDITQWGAVPEPTVLSLVRIADVISVHTPLTPETHHLIGQHEMAAMKPSAILVNASRGPVVDEAALIRILQEGRIAGAGLDVFDPEPPSSDNPLFSLDRAVVTPHVASFTQEARRLMGLTVAKDVLRVLRGEKPEFPANPTVL